MRIAGAIVLEALAFIVWNVGRRSPIVVVRDAIRARRNPRALVLGGIGLTIGLIFVVAAAVLVLPAVANPASDFAGIMTVTLLVALGLEFLVGNDVRALANRP